MKMRFGVSLVSLVALALLSGCYGGHDGVHKDFTHGANASNFEIQAVKVGEFPIAFVLNKQTGDAQAIFCGPGQNGLICQKSNMIDFESTSLMNAPMDEETEEVMED